MSQTAHLRSRCDWCPAEVVTFIDVHPKGWLTMNGESLPRPICLCPKCGDQFLERSGIERCGLEGAPA
jgi:hypothetical protein